jgi:hypothetical protein
MEVTKLPVMAGNYQDAPDSVLSGASEPHLSQPSTLCGDESHAILAPVLRPEMTARSAEVRSRITLAAGQQATPAAASDEISRHYTGCIVESRHGRRVAEFYAKEGNRR